jgi:hypothetical protein
MKTGQQLRFFPVQTGGHGFDGRGESHRTLELHFLHAERWTLVTSLEEFDRRPFYDGWEYQEVKSAKLFRLPEDLGLAIVVRIHSDAEWSVGEPTISIHVFRSETGSEWQRGTWEHELMQESTEIELLEI